MVLEVRISTLEVVIGKEAWGHLLGAAHGLFLDFGTDDMKVCNLCKFIMHYVYFKNMYILLQ